MPGTTMERCIRDCLDCHAVCIDMAMNHCLETGGRHVAPHHFRLMMNCADMCATAAGFMLSGSGLQREVCALCARVCEACARSCEDVGDMERCVAACRRCAESCHEMGAGARALQSAEVLPM